MAEVKIVRIASNDGAKKVRVSLNTKFNTLKEVGDFEPKALLVKDEDKNVVFTLKVLDAGQPMIHSTRVDIVKPAQVNENVSFLVDGNVSDAVLVRIKTRLEEVMGQVAEVVTEIEGATIPNA